MKKVGESIYNQLLMTRIIYFVADRLYRLKYKQLILSGGPAPYPYFVK